ncbi:MAG: undecaprenyl/decaprenyl-phosphate alpha-N-acetylglucosaminyl 1-phosphate transferase [Nitrospiraceae bacterium]|nr:MAG: undecaprenyl/decaprenyl-phosphate alpha-N-acetylglucosaminyl 1-phosphate transferase [Nitrospiraceae bacterium]
MLYLSTVALSVFITISLIPVMIKLADRFQMVDVPDLRKVHTIPVPRIGGLAMAFGVLVPVVLWAASDNFVRAYLAGAGTLVLFGMIDDLKGLGYKAKFCGQILAALLIIFYGGLRISSLGSLLPGEMQLAEWFKVAFTLVAIVGVTNAVNMADGLDGLAGGISLLGFCCISYLAYLAESSAVMVLSLSLAGAIFGFLRYNTHPASLFMGDTGSQLLGFSAVVLAVKVTQGHTPFSPVLPLIILGFPVLDTLVVMAGRAREGRPVFSPDKKHFHHRLISLGLSHAEAVFMIYVVQAMMIVSAILFKYYADWILMTFYALFSTLVITAFAVADRRGFRFKRYAMIDYGVKGRLRKIRDNNWVTRISFSLSKIMVPLILLLSVLLPAHVPGYASVIAVCFILCILAVRVFAKEHVSFCLRFVLYLSVPLVLYLIQEGKAAWISPEMFTVYHFSFGIIALTAFLTAKFTRRKKGFRLTTMDFLIIFIAVVVPNLPEQSIRSRHLGLLAVEIIVLLFSFEVLISEFRGRLGSLTAFTVAAMALIGIRGVAGFY